MDRKKIYAVYFVSSVLLGVIGAVLMLSLMITEYNAETNAFYITKGEKTLLSVYFAVVVALMLSSFFVLKKAGDVYAKHSAKSLIVPALMMILSFVLTVIYIISGNLSGFNSVYGAAVVLYAVFSALCAVYFILCIKKKERASDVLSPALTVLATLLLGISYFSPNYTYDLITRIILDISLCAAIVFALTDVRKCIGMKFFALRMSFGCVTVALGIAYVLSRMIMLIINKAQLSIYDAMEISLVGIVAYVISDNVILIKTNE